MNELRTSRPVVVGVDGSKAAIATALWAVDEAVSREVPLRLLYAIDEDSVQGEGPDVVAREFAVAESAVRRAFTAIEGTGQPVKIETEIVQGPPTESLIRASAAASMVCVGAIGIHHFQAGRVGSTAAALAMSARCPVAVVRTYRNGPIQPPRGIVVEIPPAPDNDVLLGAAMEEARLRNAPLRVVVCERADDPTVYHSARPAPADLDSRLARWRRRHPNLAVESTAVHGSLLDHLAHPHRSVQLVMIRSDDREHLNALIGPIGSAILQDAECSLLIVNHPQHL